MFEEKYAYLYDLFHASKNYQLEVQEILQLLDLKDLNSPTGFDFGCGTGAHALAFLEHGIRVDGYDLSEDMVKIAISKKSNLKFSSCYVDFHGTYDFTYSLFDVLSYQTTESDARILIGQLFEKTKPGGVTLVDSWNKEGVKLSQPRENARSVSTPNGEVIRKVTPREVARENVYDLDISLLSASTNEVLQHSVHSLRAWSPSEVMEIMRNIGYKNCKVYNPVSPDAVFQPNDWRFGIRAEKP